MDSFPGSTPVTSLSGRADDAARGGASSAGGGGGGDDGAWRQAQAPCSAADRKGEPHGQGGLPSRPDSLPGGCGGGGVPGATAAASSAAAAALMQGALAPDQADRMAAAAQARRRQQRAEELRAAALAPAVERTAQQVWGPVRGAGRFRVSRSRLSAQPRHVPR
jgi:hypothetical protein